MKYLVLLLGTIACTFILSMAFCGVLGLEPLSFLGLVVSTICLAISFLGVRDLLRYYFVVIALMLLSTTNYAQGVEIDFSELDAYKLVDAEFEVLGEEQPPLDYYLVEVFYDVYEFNLSIEGILVPTNVLFILMDNDVSKGGYREYRVVRDGDIIGYMSSDNGEVYEYYKD